MGFNKLQPSIITIEELYANELLGLNGWHFMSWNWDLSEEVMEEFIDKIDWNEVCCYQPLSENFIKRHLDKMEQIHWRYISEYQVLSEDFIEEFSDKLDWYNISRYQTLSEEFIIKFADKVDWHRIGVYQKVSKEFIDKHINSRLYKYYNI